MTIGVRQQADGDVLLVFQDEGVGMSEEQIEQILQPLQPFTSRDPQGSGLGLAIVHRIIRAHDGTFDIRSEPGRGTEIRIQLPGLGMSSHEGRRERRERSACG